MPAMNAKLRKMATTAVITFLTAVWVCPVALGKDKDKKDVSPSGSAIQLPAAPEALALSPDGKMVAVLHDKGLSLVEVQSQTVKQQIAFELRSSFPALLFSRDGNSLFFGNKETELWRVFREDNAQEFKLDLLTSIQEKGNEPPSLAGLALSPSGRFLALALPHLHRALIYDLVQRRLVLSFLLTGRPQDVLFSKDGQKLLASQAGEHPAVGRQPAGDSSGQAVGSATRGSVSIVGLQEQKVLETIPAGIQPERICLSRDGSHLFVANAGDDSVTSIDLLTRELAEQIPLRLSGKAESRLRPCALCLAPDGKRLYVALEQVMAIVVVSLGSQSAKSLKTLPTKVTGLIPVMGRPRSLAFNSEGTRLLVAVADPPAEAVSANSSPKQPGSSTRGTLSFLDLPTDKQLERWLVQHGRTP